MCLKYRSVIYHIFRSVASVHRCWHSSGRVIGRSDGGVRWCRSSRCETKDQKEQKTRPRISQRPAEIGCFKNQVTLSLDLQVCYVCYIVPLPPCPVWSLPLHYLVSPSKTFHLHVRPLLHWPGCHIRSCDSTGNTVHHKPLSSARSCRNWDWCRRLWQPSKHLCWWDKGLNLSRTWFLIQCPLSPSVSLNLAMQASSLMKARFPAGTGTLSREVKSHL